MFRIIEPVWCVVWHCCLIRRIDMSLFRWVADICTPCIPFWLKKWWKIQSLTNLEASYDVSWLKMYIWIVLIFLDFFVFFLIFFEIFLNFHQNLVTFWLLYVGGKVEYPCVVWVPCAVWEYDFWPILILALGTLPRCYMMFFG